MSQLQPTLVSRLRVPCRGGRVVTALGAALLLGACGGLHEDADVRDERALPADLTLLRVRVPLGSLSVHAGVAGQLRLVGRSRKYAGTAADFAALQAIDFRPTLTPTDEPGVYRYSVPALPDGVDDKQSAMVLRAELALPRAVALDIETERGYLSVDGRDANVRLWTGSGDLQVDDVHGDVEGFTGLGGGILHHVAGSVRFESGSGAVQAWIDAIGPEGIRLKTQDPSIVCHLPTGVGFDLDAAVVRSNTGKVGVKVHDTFGVPVVEEREGHRARGLVGGGGPPVILETARGWVSVTLLGGDGGTR